MPITAIAFVCIFIIGSLIALKKPFVGVLLYFFCFYMHPVGKYWGSYLPEVRWTLIVAVITLLSTLAIEKDKSHWLKYKESKLLLSLMSFVLLQSIWALNFSIHLVYVILLFKLIILFFLMVTVINTQRRLFLIIITNVIGCAYLGFEALQMHSGGRFENAGIPGIEDSNLLGIHLSPIVILASFILLCNFKKREYLILIPLAFAANLIFMTGSRGAIIALCITGIFMFYYSPKEFRSQLIRWGSVAGVAMIFLLGSLLSERVGKLINADETEELDKSAYSRIVIIEAQYEMFKESPILGSGHRSTLLLSPYFVPKEYLSGGSTGGRRSSHNLTMAVLVDHGLVGFLIYALLLYSSIMKIKQASSTKNNKPLRLMLVALCGGLFCIVISSQFSNSKVLEITFWLIALICVSTRLLETGTDHNDISANKLKVD